MGELAKKDCWFCKDVLDFYRNYYNRHKGVDQELDDTLLVRIEELETILSEHYYGRKELGMAPPSKLRRGGVQFY